MIPVLPAGQTDKFAGGNPLTDVDDDPPHVPQDHDVTGVRLDLEVADAGLAVAVERVIGRSAGDGYRPGDRGIEGRAGRHPDVDPGVRVPIESERATVGVPPRMRHRKRRVAVLLADREIEVAPDRREAADRPA